VGNNTRVEVKGVGTCKLCMHGGQSSYLHDVLFALDIPPNLVSELLLLLSCEFVMYFHDTNVELFLNSIYYGCGNLQNGLIVLDVYYASCSKLQSPSFPSLLVPEIRMKK